MRGSAPEWRVEPRKFEGGPPRSGQAQLAYDTAGRLKPLHGVALHAVLVLPALAWLLSRTTWPEHRQLTVVRIGVVVYTAVIAAVALTLL